MKKILFIHIPKTAGTTLVLFFKSILDGFFVQTNSPSQLVHGDSNLGRVKDLSDIKRILANHTGLSLHVDSDFEMVRRTDSFRSLAPCICDAQNVAYFKQFTILTIFRHPFRRFLSDYAFVRRTKEADPRFLPDLNITSIESYLYQVHPNSVLHFLLEPQLSRPRIITRDDLECVKERISDYPIHAGIFERFEESVSMFAGLMKMDFTVADLPRLNASKTLPEVDAK